MKLFNFSDKRGAASEKGLEKKDWQQWNKEKENKVNGEKWTELDKNRANLNYTHLALPVTPRFPQNDTWTLKFFNARSDFAITLTALNNTWKLASYAVPLNYSSPVAKQICY